MFDGCGEVLHSNIFDWNILCEHGKQLLKECFVSTGLVQKSSSGCTDHYLFVFSTLLFEVAAHYELVENKENLVFLNGLIRM